MAVFRLVGLRKNKRTGMWEYRRAIPKALWSLHGSREFKRSTGTGDKREAERLALPFIAQFKALLSGLEDKATASAAESRAASSAKVPLTLLPQDLTSLAGELAHALLRRHALNPAPPEAKRLNSAIRPSVRRDEPWGGPDEPWAGQRFMLLSPKNAGLPATTQGVVTGPLQALLSERGIAISPDQWETLCTLGRDALDGAYAVLQQRSRGEHWSPEALAERFPGRSSGAREPITSLVEHWKAGKERPDAKTADRLAKALKDFSTFLGHDDATQIEGGDLQRWLVSLSEKGLSAKTINEGYRAGVKACFAAAASAGALRIDPLASVKFKIKADPTKRVARHPYNDTDAAKLLQASRKLEGARKWLPWLMAYTGARIGEVSQLYREDVRYATRDEAERGGRCEGVAAYPLRRGGVYFLRLTNEGKGQRLKNAASRRDVPIHPALINAAFLEFVDSVKPGQFLFPELTTGKYGHKGDGGSRLYRKWARGEVGITDERLTAHSWRHRFEDQLRHTGVPEEVRDALTGHARKGMGARYGHGHSLATKAKWIAKVPTLRVDPRGGKR